MPSLEALRDTLQQEEYWFRWAWWQMLGFLVMVVGGIFVVGELWAWWQARRRR